MTFELWLLNTGPNKIAAIKEIRTMTGLGLKESKDIADRGGLVVRRDDDRQIEAEANALRRVGASVEVRPWFTRRWYVFNPNLSADQELLRVALGGTLVEKRHMRFGDMGSAELVRAATDDAAQEMAVLEVARQRARGHEVVENELDAFVRLARRSPELERGIEEAPDDLDAHQVYADWLIEQGDPRGELISLSIAGQDVDAWLAKHASAILGPLARSPNKLEIAWKHGSIDSLVVRQWPVIPDDELIDALVQVPAAHRMRHLEVPSAFQRGLVAADLPKSCTSLKLEADWFQLPDPEAVASLARRFEHLEIGGYYLPAIQLDSDRLKSLTIASSALDTVVRGLAESRLPALERLTLRKLARDRPEEDWGDFFTARLPSLGELTLIDAEIDHRALLRSALVKQLEVLRLLGSTRRGIDEAELEGEIQHLSGVQVIRSPSTEVDE